MQRPHLTRRAILLGTTAYAGQLGLGALTACAGATGGKLVALQTVVRGAEPAMGGFTNRHGWAIELFAAKLARGRIEYYAAEPTEGAAARLADTLLRSAHAHPGHLDAEGALLGEVTGADVIDLVEGARVLTPGRGLAGRLGSAHLGFEAEAMGGWAVEVAGEARRDGDVRGFIARAAPEVLLSHLNAPEIWGCPFEGNTELTEDGVVTLTVRPERWLADVPFELHGASHERALSPLDPLMEPFRAFVDGVRDHDAYVFRYETSA